MTPPTDPDLPIAPAPTPGGSLLVGTLAAALFLVSGGTALVYEVGWTRRLLLTLGSTATASAVVLSAFLGGLGLGALWGGRRADRSSRPLALYGALEILAGLWALAVPFLLPALEGLYVAVARSAPFLGPPLRAVVAALVVVPGAFLVGATFPLLLRAVARDGARVGASAALLYGANTLGAVGGALWAGFHGIFEHGVLGATRVAAFVALATGALAALLGSMARARRSPAPAEATAPTVAAAPLALAAASGFLALGLEAAGARVLVFFVEGFTASFAAMLGVFLAGLAVGSLVVGPAVARRAGPRMAAGVLLCVVGAAVVGGTLLLPRVEDLLRGIRASAFAAHEPLTAQRWTAIAGSAILFLVPAVALGALFPLSVRWAAAGRAEAVGRAAGRCGFWNSLGCVAGPLAVLGIGAMGGRGAMSGGPLLAWSLLGLLALIGGLLVVARVLLASRPGAFRLGVGAVAGLLVGALGAQVLAASTPAALVRAGRILRGPDGRPDPSRVLLEARSDEVTTASVVQTPPAERTLYTDEFAAAGTGRASLYMNLLGHLPVLGARDPENAMVVAFGTGTTAGAVAAHDTVRRLDIVEVSPAVYALAPWFSETNYEVLDDPRVLRRTDDGRHALLLHAADLDVITLEPLMPYVPAALPFYTREFYELARDRLRDGGVLCQWVPVHAMPLDLYASLLRTFFEVFPEGSLWYFEQSTILVGHKGPLPAPDVEAMRARMQPVQRRIRALGVPRPSVLVLGWVASARRVLQVLDDPSTSTEEAILRSPPGPLSRRVVRDETPFPEAYPAPRAGLLTPHLSNTLLWLSGLVTPSDDPAAVPETALAAPEEIPLLRTATRTTLRARAIEAIGDYHLVASRAASAAGRTDLAAELRAKARSAWQQAVQAHAEVAASPAAEDLTIVRRRARLDRVIGMEVVRDRIAEAAAARARGDAAGSAAALAAAEKLAERLCAGFGLDSVATELPAAYALHAEVLLRLGRCAAAEERVASGRRRWPWDERLADLAAFAAARRRGTEASLGDRLAALGDLPAAALPCSDEATAATRGLVASWRTAFAASRLGDVRRSGDLLLAAVRREGLDAQVVAGQVALQPPSTQPAFDAERAALLRALAPSDEELPRMLADPAPERRAAALRAAARVGFEATGTAGTVEEQFLRAPAADRRLEFVAVALDDGGAWALGRLAALLDDPDLPVREAAWKAISVRMPADARASVGYEPSADAERRAAGAKAVAEWAAKPPPTVPK